MPVNLPLDSIENRIINVERRLGALETAPALNASAITDGGLVVTSPGVIAVNAATGNQSLEAKVTTAADRVGGVSPRAVVQFNSPIPGEDYASVGTYEPAGWGAPILWLRGAKKTDAWAELFFDRGSANTVAFGGNNDSLGLPTQASVTTMAGPQAAFFYPSEQAFVQLQTQQGNWTFTGSAVDASAGSGAYCRWGVGSPAGVSEWRAQDGNAATFIPIRASAFTVSSSRAVKQDITDLPFDALAAVRAALPQSWRYRDDHSTDSNQHVSPMADDLPSEIVQADDDDLAVDLRDLVGVLWAAVGQLAAQVEKLEADMASRR